LREDLFSFEKNFLLGRTRFEICFFTAFSSFPNQKFLYRLHFEKSFACAHKGSLSADRGLPVHQPNSGGWR
jgi:hypothetical protein